MNKRFYNIVALLFIVHTCHAQVSDKDISLHVLKVNHIGKAYKFTHKDNTVAYLRYLGKVHTKTGKTYNILNSVGIWGLSHHATSRILVYNVNNRYLGNYYLTVIDDLPNYIEGNQLVFLNRRRNDKDCNVNKITYLSFNNGIPKEFFRKCEGEFGDICRFEKE